MAKNGTPAFGDLKEVVDKVEHASSVSQIESLCLNCRKNGTTRMLFTRIPFFREVVVMSFECPHCHWKNNELQPAATIQDKGIRFQFQVKSQKDCSRQIVKTEWAEVSIPQLDFQVTQQNGQITTLEGIIDRCIEGLQSTIPRITEDPESVVKISNFINNLHELKTGEKEFTLIIDDPTGNSFIENPFAPEDDPQLKITAYTRTIEQNKMIGLVADDAKNEELVEEDEGNPLDVDPEDLIKGEVHEFPTNCNNCNGPCQTRMKVTEIPHFKQIIIMATNCELCGHRTNEVKPGMGIEEKGIRIKVHIKEPKQLTYDVVKVRDRFRKLGRIIRVYF
jgi:zinc finger protein